MQLFFEIPIDHPKKEEINITIIILLGGKSKRMGGGIKSLLKINGVKIFDKILRINLIFKHLNPN